MMRLGLLIVMIYGSQMICDGYLLVSTRRMMDRKSKGGLYQASTADRYVTERLNRNLSPEGKRYQVGSVPEFNIEGDSVKAEWWQQILLFTHFTLIGFNLFQAGRQLTSIGNPLDFLNVFLPILLSTIVGDFATGVFHWAVDNYGSLKTPIFGPICVAFQGHHQTPWTITFRDFANNVYKIAIATIPFLVALTIFPISAGWKIFSVLFLNNWLLSQELHKYAHMKKEQIPKWIQWLQRKNLIISRKEHGLHHLSPHEGHYCIVNGMNNQWLDSTEFFRYLEKIVFLTTGKNM